MTCRAAVIGAERVLGMKEIDEERKAEEETEKEQMNNRPAS